MLSLIRISCFLFFVMAGYLFCVHTITMVLQSTLTDSTVTTHVDGIPVRMSITLDNIQSLEFLLGDHR
jgi:hypothetical protein